MQILKTYMDYLKVGFSFLVQSCEGLLQDLPGDSLCAACFANQHGGVPGVFGLVKLDDFSHCKRSDLQTNPP